MKPTLILVARWLLGALFIYAGFLKWKNPWETADQIAAYQLLSVHWINPVAIALPVIELVMGIFVILGCKIRPVLAGVLVLLVLFSLGLAQAMVRGLNIDCGCFGSHLGWLSTPPVALLRNGILILLAWGLYGNEPASLELGSGDNRTA